MKKLPQFTLLLSLISPLALLPAAPALAQQAQTLGTFGDWKAYGYTDKGAKVCYVASLPKKSDNAPKTRKLASFTVTHRPGDKVSNEISIETGLNLKKGAPAELMVDSTKFDLFTQGATAWTRNSDKDVVAAMAKGKGMTARFNPAQGALVVDTYSLAGFSQAKASIDKACNVK